MELEEALVVELASVPDLVGKIYPIVAPENTPTPYLAYSQGANERIANLQGYEGCLTSPQYQFDIYHSTYGQLKALKKQVLAVIKTFIQKNVSGDGPLVQGIEILTDFETYEDGVKLYKGIIEFTLDFNE